MVDLTKYLARAVQLPGTADHRLILVQARIQVLAALCRKAIALAPEPLRACLEEDLERLVFEVAVLCTAPPRKPPMINWHQLADLAPEVRGQKVSREDAATALSHVRFLLTAKREGRLDGAGEDSTMTLVRVFAALLTDATGGHGTA